MRIRSIKPEFWRSADTADLDMFTRLLFIGLWNYVDDNGVGEDDVHLIRSDLFPRDRNVDELSSLIHGGLTELSRRGQITRYRDVKSGRSYFHVAAWHHQRINRPTESKKPLPTSDDCELREDSDTTHGVFIEDSLLEQGIKGAGDQGNPPYPPDPEPEPVPLPRKQTGSEIARTKFATIQSAASVNARGIAHAYSRSLPSPIPARILGEVAKEIDACLRDEIAPEAIAAGLEAWTASDSWSPTQIPNFVHKANNRRPVVGKPTAKAMGYHEAAEQLLATLEVS